MSVSTHGFNIHTIGTILIVVGVVGLIISLLYMFAWNDRRRTSVPADTVPGDRVPRQRL